MSYKQFRNILITIFVILWSLTYHYMSVKYFYIQPHVKKLLPRVPMLFPPAGWIMFFSVDDRFSEVEVYGVKGIDVQVRGREITLQGKDYDLIDPHAVFRTRTIFFDNIHRGLMHGAVGSQNQFCTFLEFRFPYYDGFEIRYTHYPEMTAKPNKKSKRVLYQCLTQRYINDNLRK